ncbi:MAG: 6-phosphofructokinase [Deltaproteobacteria bacterium]|nr:6-phosphofructokinase [Deltaproteobacteria bacterium]
MGKRVAVLTSGGDAPGMNMAIRAIAKLGAAAGVEILGVERGYDGLMDGSFRDLNRSDVNGFAAVKGLDLIGSLGGTVLGSARSARFRTEEGRAEAAKRLADAAVDGLVVIGGNGSLTGAHFLSKEHPKLRVMGMPASIDNDIGCTGLAIGVDTALNTIVEACDRISDTARAHRRAFVVEVMGRDCGYLAMASAIAVGADAVLFREQGRSEEDVMKSVEEAIVRGFAPGRDKKRVLIIKSEGVKVPATLLARTLDERLGERLGVDIRATVLGHLVRGGSPSYQDRAIAGRLAMQALGALLEGASDEMVAWQAPVEGGTATKDSHVTRFSLERVLEETDALLDGSSPITQRRVKMMERVEGVLGL